MWPFKKVAAPEKNVSQPVVEIVRLMTENPFRFDVLFLGDIEDGSFICDIEDTATGEKIKTVGRLVRAYGYQYQLTGWLTDDEAMAVSVAAKDVFVQTEALRKEYTAYTAQYASKVERGRVMGVYCGGAK